MTFLYILLALAGLVFYPVTSVIFGLYDQIADRTFKLPNTVLTVLGLLTSILEFELAGRLFDLPAPIFHQLSGLSTGWVWGVNVIALIVCIVVFVWAMESSDDEDE